MKKPKYYAIIEKTDTGYSAVVEERAVYTTGKSISELQSNVLEALNFSLEEDGVVVTDRHVEMTFDLQQFFRYYKVLNGRFLAERIGMNPTLLSQYVKGKKQPSPKQLEKIMDGIRQMGKELSEITLVVK